MLIDLLFLFVIFRQPLWLFNLMVEWFLVLTPEPLQVHMLPIELVTKLFLFMISFGLVDREVLLIHKLLPITLDIMSMLIGMLDIVIYIILYEIYSLFYDYYD